MPYRTWAPRDRLTDVDLNAQMALVAEGRMPGALCPGGSDVSLPMNVSTELAIPAPAEGDDQGGYWQANGRLVIPKGLTGWHLLTVGLSGLQGAPKGDAIRVTIAGFGVPGLLFRFTSTGAAGVPSGAVITLDTVALELTTVYITVAADSATTGRLTFVRIARLASHGLYK